MNPAEEYKNLPPETSYEGTGNYPLNYIENTKDFRKIYSGNSQDYDKENERSVNNYDYTNNAKDPSYDTRDHQYNSGKNYKDRCLEYTGSQKLRTSVKDKTGKDFGNLNIDRISKNSVTSPISYNSNQMYVEDNGENYYQESKGRSTFQRNPYA